MMSYIGFGVKIHVFLSGRIKKRFNNETAPKSRIYS